MEVVILAGGKSKRMRPFELKPLITLLGKTILERIMKQWKGSKIYIIYNDERIKEAALEYGKKYGMEVIPLKQIPKEGTGGALLTAKPYIKGNFFVIAADHVLDYSIYEDLRRTAPNTLMATKVEQPQKYGTIIVEQGKLKEIEEKPEHPKSNLVNISLYHFTPEIFEKLEEIEESPRGEYELTDVLEGMNVLITEKKWMDVAYPWELLDAMEYLLELEPERNNGTVENSIIKGKVIIEEGAEIVNSVIEGPVYIGKNVKIGPYSHIRPKTSLEQGVEIGIGTTVKHSLVMEGTKAKHLSYIGDSVVGRNVNFGAGAVTANLRFDEKPVKPMNKRKFGAIIGDNVKLGVHAMLMPGTIIKKGEWVFPGEKR